MYREPKNKRFLLEKQVYQKSDGFCWYCGISVWPGDNFSIDHFQPKFISQKDKKNRRIGGVSNPLYTENLSNLVPCCISCNTQKCNKTIEEFRIVKTDEPHFSNKQKEYLKEKYDLDININIRPYIFWFER